MNFVEGIRANKAHSLERLKCIILTINSHPKLLSAIMALNPHRSRFS